MYRYGRDVYDNHLMLYKRYSVDGVYVTPDSVPFKTRRDTLGELWIRYNNHPLAIPAVTPVNRPGYRFNKCFDYANIETKSLQYEDADETYVSTKILDLGGNPGEDNLIPLDGLAFHDFEISRGGDYILLVHKTRFGTYHGYDVANVKFAYLNRMYDKLEDRTFMSTSTVRVFSACRYWVISPRKVE
jgi:hypothetical protein